MRSIINDRNNYYITADDVGILPTIDMAVKELVEKGIINSISVFSNASTDISWIKNLSSDVRVGLHLSFSYGIPVSPSNSIKSLIYKNGTFKSPIKPNKGITDSIDNSIGSFISSVANNFEEDELKLECNAQFYKFCDFLGRNPDFINVHHDLDCSKKVMNILRMCYPEFESRQWALLNHTLGGYIYKFLSGDLTFPEAYSEILSSFSQAKLMKKKYNLPIEIVFHPAKIYNKNLEMFSAYNLARVMEYRILSDSDILKQIV